MNHLNERIIKNKLGLLNLAAPWSGIVQAAFGRGNNARNCAILAKNDRVSLCIHETTHQTLLYDELFSVSLTV